jgi:hypothetical protein
MEGVNGEFDTNTLAEYKGLMDRYNNANQAALGQALGEFISKLI